MTATNEERREVAAKLRGCTEFAKDDKHYYAACELFGTRIYARTIEGLCLGMNILADLIEPAPERTCRMEYDPVHCDYVCTACGEWHDTPTYDARDADDALVYRDYRFCPHCGARVMEER